MEANNIRSLIIDDDPFIRDLLQDKLSQYFPEVEVMTTASSGAEGVQKISTYKPDLIFLDVEMADMTGFEMLSKLDRITFETIFITSYSHYAIKAIRFNALDYLLKPFDLGELKGAIRSYKKSVEKTPKRENITLALHNWNNKNVSDHKLILQTQEGELRLALKDIIRVEGERNYSFIYLNGGKKKLVTKTLTDMEDLLNGKGFFRCHKSHLINSNNIHTYPNSITLIMSDETEVPISRRKKEEFKTWFEEFKKEE